MGTAPSPHLGVLLLAVAGCLPPGGSPAPADGGRACGDGGVSCPPLPGLTTSCERGMCVARSPSGDRLADCAGDGRYADLQHDARNCGACGVACSGAEVCLDGACGRWCGAAQRCGDACVDTRTDRANCGACGRACADDERCAGGVCAPCAAETTPCGDACADLSTDPANCGACGQRCPAGAPCVRGVCVPCAASQTLCGTACTQLSADSMNCGACGRRCASNERCFAGACRRCDASMVNCGGACVDPLHDLRHCGACGRACGDEEHCEEGVCARCPAGTARCGYPYCIDLTGSAMNCGACGAVCPAGQACAGGRCVMPCTAITQISHDDAHCGACGAACAAGTICIEARCTAVAPRSKAPLSAARVTSARPWFRWELPADADGARVEVCATRDCATVEASWDATGDRLRAPSALASGVHFWRLYTRRGPRVEATPGIVWEFEVPAAFEPPGAGDAWDRGVTVMSDFNGDGLTDAITSACPTGPRCYEVRYAQPAGAATLPVRRFVTPPAWNSGEWTQIYALDGLRALGDLNGDGFGDAALFVLATYFQTVAIRDTANILQLFAGGPSGLSSRFQVLWSRSAFPDLPGSLSYLPVGDRDGDGYGDVAVRHGTTSHPYYSLVYGGRAVGLRADDLTDGLPFIIGDFDADGRADNAGWLNERGEVSLTGCGAPPLGTLPGPRAVVADTNDDGYDDVLATWGSGADVVRVLYLGGPGGGLRCMRLP